MKRHIWLAASIALIAWMAVGCGSSDSPSKSPTFTLIGFADHAGQSNYAPSDVTASGGTVRSCNPSRLYAFVSFSNLTPPKQFAGNWTLNGAPLSTQTFTQSSASATSFFEVQNTPQPLIAGAYTFQLTVDSVAATQGNFTLAC